MLPILDNDMMREADRHTIVDLGVPSLILMENAATGLVDALRENFPHAQRVVILAGGGNNGGDGLAAARHLHNGGIEVRIALLADPEKLSPDCSSNLRMAKAFGLEVVEVSGDAVEIVSEWLVDSNGTDVVIDALLGTGLTRTLEGRLATLAEFLNDSDVPVLAVDVPTGLNGSSSCAAGPVIQADLTVTFGTLKRCHVLSPACLLCGQVVVVDIGIPPHALESATGHWLIEEEDVRLLLPHRKPSGHKGTFGHLLIVAGARGRGGAAAMAARAAVAMGSGLVSVAVPAPVVNVVDGACLEAMTIALPENDDGEAAGAGTLWKESERMTALVIGPGIGTGTGAAALVADAISGWQGPLLLDADGLNCCAGHPERLAGRTQPPILTPHPGELGRLIGWRTSRVVDDRLGAALNAAERSGAIVVAKGHRTIIADPEGRVWVNPTGDQRLATGGSGDVLAGAIGALLAQGLDPVRAATVGVWLHGRAGEIGVSTWPAAVPAAELPGLLAAAWKEIDADGGLS